MTMLAAKYDLARALCGFRTALVSISAISGVVNVLALTGSIGTKGGTNPNGWAKFIPHGPDVPAHAGWNELAWPPSTR